jgi:hypothetical protein
LSLQLAQHIIGLAGSAALSADAALALLLPLIRREGCAPRLSAVIVQHALQHLQPQTDPPMRRAAAGVVGNAPSLTDAHAAQLSLLISDEQDDDVWAACARALTRAACIRPAEAESLIVHLGCASWDVRAAAVAALAQLRLSDETLIGALLDRMASDTDAEVVLHAQRGIVALTRAPSASTEACGDERVVSALIVNLGDEREKVRHGAVEALAECGLGADALVGALSQRLTTSDPRVLKHLARAFSALGVRAEDDRAITALIVILGHADADVRCEARDVLAAMGLVDEKMTRRLVAMLSDERPALWACAPQLPKRTARYPARHGVPHGTVSRTAWLVVWVCLLGPTAPHGSAASQVRLARAVCGRLRAKRRAARAVRLTRRGVHPRRRRRGARRARRALPRLRRRGRARRARRVRRGGAAGRAAALREGVCQAGRHVERHRAGPLRSAADKTSVGAAVWSRRMGLAVIR